MVLLTPIKGRHKAEGGGVTFKAFTIGKVLVYLMVSLRVMNAAVHTVALHFPFLASAFLMV